MNITVKRESEGLRFVVSIDTSGLIEHRGLWLCGSENRQLFMPLRQD